MIAILAAARLEDGGIVDDGESEQLGAPLMTGGKRRDHP